jgi:hypothetical protein
MSCPYFHPAEPRRSDGNRRHAMLPLGDLWTGECHALKDKSWVPDDERVNKFCNLGYARGHCDRFPDNAGPDAVRFTVSRDNGSSLLLYYVIERDHHPFAHGPLECPLPQRTVAAAGPLARQAEAYAGSYFRRKEA